MIFETSEKDQGEQYLEASYITFDFISGFFLWLWRSYNFCLLEISYCDITFVYIENLQEQNSCTLKTCVHLKNGHFYI